MYLAIQLFLLFKYEFFSEIRMVFLKLHMYVSGFKVGRMTQTIWITWVTFLVGQVVSSAN